MNVVKKSFVAILSMLLLSSSAFGEGIEFQKMSLDEAIEKAEKENKGVFIDVFATWCGPCKYLTNNVFTDRDLGEYMNENFVCLKIDGEKGEGPRLMGRFDISAYPTMLFLDTDKSETNRIVGAGSAEDIIDAGKEITNPEDSEAFQIKSKYEGGERSKEFMHEYIEFLLVESMDYDDAVSEYLKLYPSLNLNSEEEFVVFCLGIEDFEDESMKKFIADPFKYDKMYDGLGTLKMNLIMGSLVPKALEARDPDIINNGVNKFYKDYKQLNGVDSYSKSELIEVLNEAYTSEIEGD